MNFAAKVLNISYIELLRGIYFGKIGGDLSTFSQYRIKPFQIQL